jgi:D-alanyl-D-alanine carboxypeptidase
MRKFFTRMFDKDIFPILIIGICLFGVYKYTDYRFNLVENRLDLISKESSLVQNSLESKVKNVEDFLLETQNTLTTEQQKNSSLKRQFSRITNTVDNLQKLSTTDPELLKKYSKAYFLNEHYIPISLSDIPVDYRATKSTNFQILSDVLPHFEDMVDAGKEDGVNILAQSAYRSFATQYNLKAAYKVTYGVGANTFSADQGYSEHQLGTAIDLTTGKTNGGLEGFDKTPEYKWLNENAYKYGFIISYPAGNKYYIFEPWHWRFVGIELANRLHDDNMYFYNMDQRTIDSYLANIFD